jgi:hypothetical protein
MIREKYPDGMITLFMDNLVVHKTRSVKAVYDRLHINTIFNVPYSP